MSLCFQQLVNRRLARNVYLGVVPLMLSATGLHLAGNGDAVEWLVQMRRLPRHLILDHAIQEGRVNEQDIVRLTGVLANFCRSANRGRLELAIEENGRALATPEYQIEPGTWRDTAYGGNGRTNFGVSYAYEASHLDQSIVASRIWDHGRGASSWTTAYGCGY